MSKTDKNEKQYTTQQIWIKKGHRMHSYFQNACVNSKNMYNTTNFFIRQMYTGLKSENKLHTLQKEVLDTITKQLSKMNDVQTLAYESKIEKANTEEKRKKVKLNLFKTPSKENPYVDYNFLDALFKSIGQADYRSLPAQTSQGIMKTVFSNWKSFFSSLKDYKVNPSKYKARPNIPKYSKAKEKEAQFTNQDCVIKDGKFLKFPKTKERLNIGKLGFTEGKLNQVRVIPKYGHYVVELIFEIGETPEKKPSNERFLSLDLGIDNLATITTNTGRRPELVKGKRVKYVNQYYNKQRAHYLGILRNGKNSNQGPFSSKRLERLHQKRHLKIKDAFHKTSAYIVKTALEEDVDTIIIGLNKDWKQNSNIGKKNNQSFVNIPHSLLISMIEYKAEKHGIKVELTEEAYTSKASFLDEDKIPVYQKGVKHKFSGRRVKRGLYKTADGFLVNADVNGSANIMKKFFEKTFKKILNIQKVNVWNPETICV